MSPTVHKMDQAAPVHHYLPPHPSFQERVARIIIAYLFLSRLLLGVLDMFYFPKELRNEIDTVADENLEGSLQQKQ